jgi:large subunit ribosomal protein L10
VLAELVARLRSSATLIVADYRGLSMSEMDGVRTELLKHGARFSVVKNTLTRRAADEAGVKDLVELLDGPSAIAFVDDGDMVGVAKTLQETARRTRILEIRGGILDGQRMTADQVRELATLPPADVLRGQVLGAIVAPLTAIARLVNAPLQNLVGLIDARIEQLQADEPAGAVSHEEAAATEETASEAPTEDDQQNQPEAEASAPETEEGEE